MQMKKIDELEPIIRNDVLQVRENNNRKEVDFYLINVIEDIGDYIDFLREVENCREGDLVTVHINCLGGDLDATLQIYDVLKSSLAKVEISIEGACCSGASMIMLTGNLWRLTPHCYVMIHSWNGCIGGKWIEIKKRYKYDEEIIEKQFRELYKNFLSDKEIQECLDGKDFYFDCNEIEKRLNNYQKEDLEKNESIKKT